MTASANSLVPPQTIAAYLAARYCIEVPGRPGGRSAHWRPLPRLSALYREHGAASMAFLTACNPLGAVVADDENERAMAVPELVIAALIELPSVGFQLNRRPER